MNAAWGKGGTEGRGNGGTKGSYVKSMIIHVGQVVDPALKTGFAVGDTAPAFPKKPTLEQPGQIGSGRQRPSPLRFPRAAL